MGNIMPRSFQVAFAAVAIIGVLSGCSSTKGNRSYLLAEMAEKNDQSRIDLLKALPSNTPVRSIRYLVSRKGVDTSDVIRVSNKAEVVRKVRLGNAEITGTPAELEADRKKWQGVEAWFITATQINSKWSLGWSTFDTKETGLVCELTFLVKNGRTIGEPYFDIREVDENNRKAALPAMLEGVIKTAPGVAIGAAGLR